MSFDSCIASTSGCVVSKRCLSSSTVLLMPFENNFYLFVFCFVALLFVACVGVCWCEGLGWALLGWRCMEVCVMGICGESRDV